MAAPTTPLAGSPATAPATFAAPAPVAAQTDERPLSSMPPFSRSGAGRVEVRTAAAARAPDPRPWSASSLRRRWSSWPSYTVAFASVGTSCSAAARSGRSAGRRARRSASGRRPPTSARPSGPWPRSRPRSSDRRVEITGPVERKMMINALNSGADGFMADFEDALSPTWANVIEGQATCADAVRGTLDSRRAGRQGLPARTSSVATLLVRPRGWHLAERHLRVDGAPVSATLFDFGLYFFHNAAERLARGSGPVLLPAQAGEPPRGAALERRLRRGRGARSACPRGTIRATVLIETMPAAFEMDEILYELRDARRRPQRRPLGLHLQRASRRSAPCAELSPCPRPRPGHDDGAVHARLHRAAGADLPPARRARHRRHGRLHPQPPRSPRSTAAALAKVREDKEREAGDGFDGTWVAHPDLVPVAAEVFDGALGARPHQKEVPGHDDARARGCRGAHRPRRPRRPGDRGGCARQRERRPPVPAAWLGGSGAVAINNLMEDVATAEISPRAALAVGALHVRAGRRRSERRSGAADVGALRGGARRGAGEAGARGAGCRGPAENGGGASGRDGAGGRMRGIPHAGGLRAAGGGVT